MLATGKQEVKLTVAEGHIKQRCPSEGVSLHSKELKDPEFSALV